MSCKTPSSYFPLLTLYSNPAILISGLSAIPIPVVMHSHMLFYFYLQCLSLLQFKSEESLLSDLLFPLIRRENKCMYIYMFIITLIIHYWLLTNSINHHWFLHLFFPDSNVSSIKVRILSFTFVFFVPNRAAKYEGYSYSIME